MLDFQRLEHGRFDVQYRPFPLHRAIQSLLGAVRVATHAKGLKLNVELDPQIDALVPTDSHDQQLWVIGDEIRLRQVANNLWSVLTRPR